jgi:hypothetical protein
MMKFGFTVTAFESVNFVLWAEAVVPLKINADQ